MKLRKSVDGFVGFLKQQLTFDNGARFSFVGIPCLLSTVRSDDLYFAVNDGRQTTVGFFSVAYERGLWQRPFDRIEGFRTRVVPMSTVDLATLGLVCDIRNTVFSCPPQIGPPPLRLADGDWPWISAGIDGNMVVIASRSIYKSDSALTFARRYRTSIEGLLRSDPLSPC